MGCDCCKEEEEERQLSYEELFERDRRTYASDVPAPIAQGALAHWLRSRGVHSAIPGASAVPRPPPQWWGLLRTSWARAQREGFVNGFGAARAAHAQPQPQHRTDVCTTCGARVDPALLDGHLEACRANHRREILERQRDAPSKPPPVQMDGARRDSSVLFDGDSGDDDDDDAERMCCVCFERRRAVAFVPCGHLVVCEKCCQVLDACPVCRGPRQSLLFVDPRAARQCFCGSCKNVIHPTYFEGHREVCALRMRQLREAIAAEEAEAAAAEADGDAGANGGDDGRATNSAASSIPHGRGGHAAAAEIARSKCLNCLRRERTVALLPCGHSILCSECAASTNVCPLCLRDVASRMHMFK